MKFIQLVKKLVAGKYTSATVIDSDGVHHPVCTVYRSNGMYLCRFISGRIMIISEEFQPIENTDSNRVTLNQLHNSQLVVNLK